MDIINYLNKKIKDTKEFKENCLDEVSMMFYQGQIIAYTNAKIEAEKEQLTLGVVTKRWLFWFESQGKNGYTFEIEAKDSDDAYNKAYDSYGPQVTGMMYQVI